MRGLLDFLTGVGEDGIPPGAYRGVVESTFKDSAAPKQLDWENVPQEETNPFAKDQNLLQNLAHYIAQYDDAAVAGWSKDHPDVNKLAKMQKQIYDATDADAGFREGVTKNRIDWGLTSDNEADIKLAKYSGATGKLFLAKDKTKQAAQKVGISHPTSNLEIQDVFDPACELEMHEILPSLQSVQGTPFHLFTDSRPVPVKIRHFDKSHTTSFTSLTDDLATSISKKMATMELDRNQQITTTEEEAEDKRADVDANPNLKKIFRDVPATDQYDEFLKKLTNPPWYKRNVRNSDDVRIIDAIKKGDKTNSTEDYQFKPHIVPLYISSGLKGTNLDEFLCTAQGIPSNKQLSPGAIFWTMQMPRLKNSDLEGVWGVGTTKNKILKWFKNKKLLWDINQQQKWKKKIFKERMKSFLYTKLHRNLREDEEKNLEELLANDSRLQSIKDMKTRQDGHDKEDGSWGIRGYLNTIVGRVQDIIFGNSMVKKFRKNYGRETYYGKDLGRYRQYSNSIHRQMLIDMIGRKREEIKRLAEIYNDETMPKNLVLENYFKKYFGMFSSDLQHPFVKFAKPQDYVRIQLEDLSTKTILWDAVFNMRNQKKDAGTLKSMLAGVIGKTPSKEHSNRYMLAPDARPFHGSQQKMIKICPRKSDMVPRMYTLTAYRFPNKEPVEDFIGKAIFQSYNYVDSPPNFLNRKLLNDYNIQKSSIDNYNIKNSDGNYLQKTQAKLTPSFNGMMT